MATLKEKAKAKMDAYKKAKNMTKLKIKRKKTNVAERTKWNPKRGGSGIDESLWTENENRDIKHNKHRVVRNPLTGKIIYKKNVSEVVSTHGKPSEKKRRYATQLKETTILGKKFGGTKQFKGKKADRLNKKLRKKYAKAKKRN